MKGPPRSLAENKSLSTALSTLAEVRRWLHTLSSAIAPRILHDASLYHRWPKALVLICRIPPSKTFSRSCAMPSVHGVRLDCQASGGTPNMSCDTHPEPNTQTVPVTSNAWPAAPPQIKMDQTPAADPPVDDSYLGPAATADKGDRPILVIPSQGGVQSMSNDGVVETLTEKILQAALTVFKRVADEERSGTPFKVVHLGLSASYEATKTQDHGSSKMRNLMESFVKKGDAIMGGRDKGGGVFGLHRAKDKRTLMGWMEAGIKEPHKQTLPDKLNDFTPLNPRVRKRTLESELSEQGRGVKALFNHDVERVVLDEEREVSDGDIAGVEDELAMVQDIYEGQSSKLDISDQEEKMGTISAISTICTISAISAMHQRMEKVPSSCDYDRTTAIHDDRSKNALHCADGKGNPGTLRASSARADIHDYSFHSDAIRDIVLATVECPICGVRVSADIVNRHANAHFEETGSAEPRDDFQGSMLGCGGKRYESQRLGVSVSEAKGKSAGGGSERKRREGPRGRADQEKKASQGKNTLRHYFDST